jgi:hypothetical protein
MNGQETFHNIELSFLTDKKRCLPKEGRQDSEESSQKRMSVAAFAQCASADFSGFDQLYGIEDGT